MRSLRTVISFVLLSVAVLALAACGSSGTSSTDPAAGSGSNNNSSNTGGLGGPIFSNTSTATQIALATDVKSIDTANGEVLVTATVTSAGQAAAGKTVHFSIVAPDNTDNSIATIRSPDVLTNSQGVAQTRLTTGNTATTTNVIVRGTTTVNSQAYAADVSFQIVRGTGVIMFTSEAGTTPGQQTNLYPVVKEDVYPVVPSWRYLQLIPFKLTDANGNPRPGVPVTISTYSITSSNPGDVTIGFLAASGSEPTATTVTTDSAGQGIFSAAITIPTPPVNVTNTVNVVFKAKTSDAVPITGYVGGVYALTCKPLPATPVIITPPAAGFGSNTDLFFTIAGGTKPYSVTSNNSANATATLQADGITIKVHLVNTNDWTGAVTISAIDSAGQAGTATVSRN